jgi:hypothetical protein
VGVVLEESGVEEEELGLEEGGKEQKRNEDVLSPNPRKTTDRRMGRTKYHFFFNPLRAFFKLLSDRVPVLACSSSATFSWLYCTSRSLRSTTSSSTSFSLRPIASSCRPTAPS